MNEVINKLIQMTKEDGLFWCYTDYGYETDYDNISVLIDYGDLDIGGIRFLGYHYPLIKLLGEEMYKNVERQAKDEITLNTVDDVIDNVMGW